MSRHATGWLLALLSSCVATINLSHAQGPSASLEAQLESGEFSAALEQVRQAPRAERDPILRQIAIAQASSGARSASLYTAAEMVDDRARASLLDELGSRPRAGAFGGGAEPDFDALIELIETTIAPNSWQEVGGPGAIDEFAGGVFVDPDGVLKQISREDTTVRLSLLRSELLAGSNARNGDGGSPLRKVSLTRLEKQVQIALAAGREPTDAMRKLAGLQRIKYVFVYPESRELVIAGPANDWRSIEHGRPAYRLEDFVVILRHMNAPDARFGCSITPTQEGLPRTQAFLKQSAANPISPARRDAWLEQVRAKLGKQDIDVFGLEPRTRVARVLVEADYHMKLIGMGLEGGVVGVESYLDSVTVPPGQSPLPMDVLRWWFTLNYDSVLASPDRTAFELRGQGVKVMSENELLTAQGKRVHTGNSDELNRRFAHSFTDHFEALCQRYPLYAELRNIFDLAMLAAVIRSEGLADRIDWQMQCFGPKGNYPVALGPEAKQVDTVMNHRVIRGKHILAGISGGVMVAPAKYVEPDAIETDTYGRLSSEHIGQKPAALPRDAWWWD